MFLFPLAFALMAAVVGFAGASYLFFRYRRRYESAEISAALVISAATFLFLVTMFYGEQILRGKTGEGIVGWTLALIIILAGIIVYRSLRRSKSST